MGGWMSAFCRTISVAEEEEEGGQGRPGRMRVSSGEAGERARARGTGTGTKMVGPPTGVDIESGRVTDGRGHTPDHVRGRDHHDGREEIRLPMTMRDTEIVIEIETGTEEQGKSSGHTRPSI